MWTPLWSRLGSLGEVNSGEHCQKQGWPRYNQCPPEDGEDGRQVGEAALSLPGRDKGAPGGSRWPTAESAQWQKLAPQTGLGN